MFFCFYHYFYTLMFHLVLYFSHSCHIGLLWVYRSAFLGALLLRRPFCEMATDMKD